MKDYEKYLIKLTKEDIAMINSNVNLYGFDEIKSWYFRSIDCSRIVSNIRVNCTIYFTYNHDLSCLVYLINQENEITKQNDLCKINEIHNNNIEFELKNPPIPIKSNTKNKEKKKEKHKDVYVEMLNDKISFTLNLNKI